MRTLSLKKYLFVATVLITLLVLIGFEVRRYLEPIVKTALVTMVSESTQGRFSLNITRLDIRLLNGGFSMSDVVLASDSSVATVARVDVRRIGVIRFLRYRELRIGSIRIESPSIDHMPSLPRTSTDTDSIPPVMARLFDAIQPNIKSVSISMISMTNGSLSIRNRGGGYVMFNTVGLQFTLKNLSIDSTLTIPSDIDFGAKSVAWSMDTSPYRLQTGRIEGSTSAQTISVDHAKWVPLAGYETFAMTYRRHNRVAFDMAKLEISGWNSDAFLHGDGFITAQISLHAPSLEVAHDKRLPPKPFKVRKLMHLMLEDLPIPVDVDLIRILDGKIVYRHRHQDHDVPAVLTFDELSSTLTHVSNTSSRPMTMHTETRVMGEGRLTVDVRFATDDPSGRHTVKGRFVRSSFASFNPVLENMVFMKATGGYLNRMEFDMELDDRSSTGSVTMDYEDVTVRMIGDGQRFKTFIANRFILNKDHTGKDSVPQPIGYVRLQEKNIFHYWWMSLFSGMKPVLGM